MKGLSSKDTSVKQKLDATNKYITAIKERTYIPKSVIIRIGDKHSVVRVINARTGLEHTK